MRALLEFNLPEDAWAHRMALNGADYHSAIRELSEHLRGRIKHADLSDSAREELNTLRGMIYELVPDLDED